MSAVQLASALGSVVIVEDHPLFAEALRRLLEAGGRLGPVRCAAGEAEALRVAEGGPEPKVFVIDLRLLDGSGLGLLRQVRARWPSAACVVVTASDSPDLLAAARAAGAVAVVSKSADPLAIRSAREAYGGADPEAGPFDTLTFREREVLRLIGRGLNTRELAKELFVSPKTIETHRVNLKKKLGADDVYKLMRIAAKYG